MQTIRCLLGLLVIASTGNRADTQEQISLIADPVGEEAYWALAQFLG